MRVRFPWDPLPSDEHPVVELLRSEDLRYLRLPWLSRFTPATLAAYLSETRDTSLWVPRTGEYVVAGHWRSRSEIVELKEVHARKGKSTLVRALLDRLRGQGRKLALMSDETWDAGSDLYTQLGFRHLERIIFFRKALNGRECEPLRQPIPALAFSLVAPRDLDLLVQLDHDSFPWLWWNSRDEFGTYIQMPGVSVYTASLGQEPVGYTSFTIYNSWAHLDRIAVASRYQGRGFGAAQLRHVLCTVHALGAKAIHLSTQQNNPQSHRLYAASGFRQTSEKMNFYGLHLA